MPEPAFVETDHRGRVTLPVDPNTRFLLRYNGDGSILPQPARVVTDAQYEYQSISELRALVAEAAAAPTIRRSRRHRE